MTKIKSVLFLIVLLTIALIFSSCSLFKLEPEPFHLTYRYYGGFSGGVHSQIEIFENGDLIYKDYSHSIKTKAGNENMSNILNALNNNNFLGLNNVYDDQICCDGTYSEVTYVSDSDSHRVTVSHCTMSQSIGIWKTRFNNIVESIYACVDSNDLNIDTAIVRVHNPITIFQWPYTQEFPLAENIGSYLSVDNDILQFVQGKEALSEVYYCALFHEDSLLYYVNSPGDTALNIYNQTAGTKWPFSPKLSEIPDDGFLLTGNDVFWLKDTLANLNYPEIFYDSKTGADAKVYWVYLKQGNYFTDSLF